MNDQEMMARVQVFPTTPWRMEQPVLLQQDVPFRCVRFQQVERGGGANPPSLLLHVYSPGGESDFEGDPSHLVYAEFLSFTTSPMWQWPDVEIYGHVEKMQWATEVGESESDGGNAYTPRALSDWKPGLYRLRVSVHTRAQFFESDVRLWHYLVCPSCEQERACHSEPCDGDPDPNLTGAAIRQGA